MITILWRSTMRTLKKHSNTLGVFFFMALAEAIGTYLLICGIFHLTIMEIGRWASVGYITGICGFFFGLLLLFHLDDLNSKNIRTNQKH